MKTTFTAQHTEEIRSRLKRANQAFAHAFPGDSDRRQAAHTVYGGAHLFKSDTARKMGDVAMRALQENAPDARALATAVGMDSKLADRVYPRVVEKISREAVEDFRIDFEDGYGNRPDAEEDGHAVAAAVEVANGLQGGTLPPFIGIRVKPFSEELVARSSRTLDLFVTALAEKAGRRMPPGFVVTIPKVTHPEQVSAISRLCGILEERLGLENGCLRVELMIETPQSIIGSRGEIALPALVAAASGRCAGAHFGTYDYTALCNVTAAYQAIQHPACDFAKHVMQVSLAQTGVNISDGATTLMPIGPHKAPKGGELTPTQKDENRAVVHRAWRAHYENVQHALRQGFYQGWDLHPGQLPIRYASTYAFFLEGLEAASARLRNFVEKAAQATLIGDVFDDAATGQGLLNYFLRGISCGAIHEDEAKASGLALEEIRLRSFLKILSGRRASQSASASSARLPT